MSEQLKRRDSETLSETRDRWLAIAENWLTKAYPRGWQRKYVARGIVGELLADLQEHAKPAEVSLPPPTREELFTDG